jgi:hypothetical protein
MMKHKSVHTSFHFPLASQKDGRLTREKSYYFFFLKNLYIFMLFTEIGHTHTQQKGVRNRSRGSENITKGHHRNVRECEALKTHSVGGWQNYEHHGIAF